MRSFLSAVLLACVFAVVGCSEPPPPPPATAVTYDTVNAESNHEKQISIEGYPRLPSMTMVSSTIRLELHEQADGKGKIANLSIPVGSRKNRCVKPPKEFKETDLALTTNDGVVVGMNDKIRVSGKAHWSKTTQGKDYVILGAPIFIDKL